MESGNYEGNNFDWDKNILVGAPSAGSTRFGFLVESDFQLEDKSTPPIVVNFKERTFGGAGTCDAWYKNSEGYNWTLWPSDCITYWSVFQLYVTRNLTKLNHRPCRVRPSDATFFDSRGMLGRAIKDNTRDLLSAPSSPLLSKVLS